MPSSAPRRMITTSRLSVGAEASARVARPILRLVASPSRAVRRVTPERLAPVRTIDTAGHRSC